MSNISISTGSEGPRHDPYSYQEITVERQALMVTAHYGLAVWLDIDRLVLHFSDSKALDEVFTATTGMTLAQAERAVRKLKELPYREHRKHGGFEWADGFPGEALCFCKCGHVVDSTFNAGAII